LSAIRSWSETTRCWTNWAGVVAKWIGEGRTPFFFVHHPDDAGAPALGRRLHEKVRALTDAVGLPPAWPAELEPQAPDQLDLF